MSEDTRTLEKRNWEILYGGVDWPVRVVNVAEKAIRIEAVKVRKVPLKDLGQMGAAMEDVEKEAMFYTERSLEEIRTWDPDSVLEVVEEGRRLNEKSFKAWFEIQRKKAALMGIDLDRVVSQAVDKAVSGSTKSSSS